jgi:CRISPR-associated protein Cas5d
MPFGVRLHVWGERACFTRPEMKGERVSYDVITPSAARGILEAVHWKPAIRWHVNRIRVLKPVVFETLRRRVAPRGLRDRSPLCHDGPSRA